MENKKSFWYVLVLTNAGAVFVTGIDRASKIAYWNREEQPKELSMNVSKDLAMGLRCNGYKAFTICNFFELTEQPYRYNMGHFEWVNETTE